MGVLATPCEDKDMDSLADEADRNLADFSIVRPIVRKDQRIAEIELLHIGEIDAVLDDIPLPFRLIPGEHVAALI